jgi:hypothetical protein
MTQRVQIPVTGITTTSSYEEGSCYSLVNLRPKNGALHPVSPRKIVQELSQKYDIVFVHQNNDYKNWTGVVNSNGRSSVYWDVRNEQPEAIASIQGTVNSVQQIGNTLSLITEDNIYYLLFQEGGYIFLGELPEIPAISLRTSSQGLPEPYRYATEYGDGAITQDNFIEATKGLVYKAMDLLVNGGIINKKGETFDGYGMQLFDACFIRYAFRLYDGSLTKHSPPILIMPEKDILSMKTIDYAFINKRLGKKSNVDVYAYNIYMFYNFNQLGNDSYERWTDIIKSVDIFMSQPLGLSNIENIRKDMSTKGPEDVPSLIEDDMDNDLSLTHYNLIKELTPELLKNVSNTSTFYLMRSIKLSEGGSVSLSEKFPSADSNVSNMENVIFQEVMTDDNFSHHKYGARASYVYNNRLHLANVKTTFFEGFSPDYFLWFIPAAWDDGNYNGYSYKDAPGKLYTDLMLEVEISTGITNEKVHRHFEEDTAEGVYRLFMSGFISYPDPRARRITIYRRSDNLWYKVFSKPLEAHGLLNLAYYVNDGLKPIVEDVNVSLANMSVSAGAASLSEPNKIKVSELNNPLSFPNVNTYLTGNGTILAMATNAMLVSDRNKGQFPLYVFTTQGIWSLNVGNGEVVYSTLSDPTSQKTPVSEYVCEIPGGVIFITKNGLNILNNNEDTLITPHIEEQPMGLNIEMNSHCDGVVFNPEQRGFDELVENIRMLIYDPHKDEVIINCDSELNYVLNFKSSSFYQSTEKIDLVVGNIYPELFVVSTG